jgi:hypothetical protein
MRVQHTNQIRIVIEIVVAIVVCAILALLVYLILRPADRLVEIQNRQRLEQVKAIGAALFQCAFDNKGRFPDLETGKYYMIGKGDDFSGCQQQELDGIYNLADFGCGSRTLVPNYISTVPVAPAVKLSAAKEVKKWHQDKTGFYIMKLANGRILIGACDADIKIIR